MKQKGSGGMIDESTQRYIFNYYKRHGDMPKLRNLGKPEKQYLPGVNEHDTRYIGIENILKEKDT